jgi:hypothetical protein
MQFLQMIWNGTANLGAGTVILKALFIILLGAVFWMLCELVKYLANVMSKLAVNALRYLAIAIRGWPTNGEEDEVGMQGAHGKQSGKSLS